VVLKIEPKLQLCKFEELSPGDLFIYFHDNGSCVALKAEDPTQNGEKLVIPFGPAFPRSVNGPCLLEGPQTNVISFGKDFILRFSSYAEGWSASEPTENTVCILKTRDRFFLRANFSPRIAEFLPCYIDMSTGLINADTEGLQDRFTRPRGIWAVAVEWELLTIEPEPRLIFAQRATRDELR
jgi:hypothetical protein